MASQENTNLKEHLIGVLLVVSGFFFAAIMNALGKVAVKTIPLMTILFMQNLFALCFISPFIIRSGFKLFSTQKIGLHFIRAITGLLSYACFFIAVNYISLVDATLLASSAPLFLPFVIRVWLGQKILPSLWVSIVIGYAGVFFLLKPSADMVGSSMVFVALLGGLFSAMALQSVRNLAAFDSSLKIIFYYFLLSVLVVFPFFIFQWEGLGLYEWLVLIGMGAALGLAQFLISKAYTYATPTLLGPFNFSIVVFAGLIQWLKWGFKGEITDLIGMFLVVSGGILTIIQQKRVQKNNQPK